MTWHHLSGEHRTILFTNDKSSKEGSCCLFSDFKFSQPKTWPGMQSLAHICGSLHIGSEQWRQSAQVSPSGQDVGDWVVVVVQLVEVVSSIFLWFATDRKSFEDKKLKWHQFKPIPPHMIEHKDYFRHGSTHCCTYRHFLRGNIESPEDS